MIPEYSFLFDNPDEEVVHDDPSNIPLAPKLNAHIHPKDFFKVSIHDTTYVGEYISERATRIVPSWQQSSGLPCGDQLALFRIYTTTSTMDEHMIRVLLEDLSKCIGLEQVHQTNAITGCAFIAHEEVVQNVYLQFGGK